MSYISDWFAYNVSIQLSKSDPSFYGLLMAAMRKADSTNAMILKSGFPEVWADLQARCNVPHGILDTDSDGLKRRVLA